MQPLLRQANMGDIQAILQLEQQCFTGDKISPRQMRYLLAKAKAYCQVVQLGELIVAYSICLTPKLPRPARLYSLAVSPAHQGQGLAQKLIQASEQNMQRLGYQCLRLEVSTNNPKAYALYDYLGFKKLAVVKKYYADGSDALRMQKSLSCKS